MEFLSHDITSINNKPTKTPGIRICVVNGFDQLKLVEGSFFLDTPLILRT